MTLSAPTGGLAFAQLLRQGNDTPEGDILTMLKK
jgi:hypothetical protein